MTRMRSWPTVRLGEVCEFKYGKGLPAECRTGQGAAVYGSNGIVGFHSEALTSGKTIVIGRKGSFGEVHVSDDPCWPIDTTYYVDSESTEVDLQWLAYSLRSIGLKDLNRAAAIPGLNRADAYRQQIRLPPPAEQRRIARVLDAADGVRAKRRDALAAFPGLTDALFVEKFGDPLREPARWPLTTIGDVGAVVTGNTPSREEPDEQAELIGWIKADNLGRGPTFPTAPAEFVDRNGSKRPRVVGAGSVLVTCIAGSPSSIGNLALADRDVAFNQQINAVVPERMEPPFLYTQLRLAKRRIQSMSSGGMKGMVSKSRFAAIRLIEPPRNQQDAFNHLFWSGEAARNAAAAHAAQVDELFASLQARAFAGEL